MDLSTKKLILVTGKGGVGKSICAAAIAWREAQAHRRVCLVELGNQSFYESFFETRGITYEPSEVIPKIHIALLNAESSLREYVLHYLKVPKLYDILFQNKIMKTFLNAAPALAELSIMGKLTADIRGIMKSDYDVFVVDCYSTGHALALLRAPKGLSTTFRNGPLYEQAHQIGEILLRRDLTHYVLVTLPEEMPVTEAKELYGTLTTEFNAEISVVCNKLTNPPITRDEALQLERSVQDPGMTEFLNYLKFKQETQDSQLKKLAEFAPVFYGVPQILRARRGQEYVEIFAQHLEKPWE